MRIKNFKPLKKYLRGFGLELTELHEANISVAEKDGVCIYNYNNNVLVPRGDPIIRKCRGIGIDYNGNVVNLPFDRFFNYHEEERDDVDIENAEVIEKLDGSMIAVWWDGKEWEVTTRGSFYPNENSHNFKETFIRLFDEFDELVRGYTYIFELISKDNRIVTKYDSERVVLIGVREIKTGDEVNQDGLDQIAGIINAERPRRFKASSIEECRELFNELKDDEEGLVVIDKDFKRFKLKQQSYLKMAKIISLKNQDVLDYVLGRVELDADFTDMPELKEKTIRVKAIYDEVKQYAELMYSNLEHIEEQKDFAEAAKNYQISGVLFKLRKGMKFDDMTIRWDRLEEYHYSIVRPEPRKLVVFRGVPGCGKSTWIKENNLEVFTICPDTLRLMFRLPCPHISQDNDHAVWSILYKMLENRMIHTDFTIIDACHATNKSLKKYRQLCNMYGYILIEKKFDISLAEALKRNDKREEYKQVPEEVITRMHNSLSENFINRENIE